MVDLYDHKYKFLYLGSKVDLYFIIQKYVKQHLGTSDAGYIITCTFLILVDETHCSLKCCDRFVHKQMH